MKLLYIGNKLMKHGFSATSIDTLGPLLEKEGYFIYYASEKKTIFRRLVDMLWSTIKYRKEIDFVLIDTYSRKSFYGIFLVTFLCRIFKLNYILYLHGGNLPDRLKSSLLLSKQIFDNAYKLVSPSGYLEQAFFKKGYVVTVIPNSMDVSGYKFKIRRNITPKLLFVRSFHEIYNPLMAIEVLRKIKEVYPESKLCMIGPDKDGTLIKAKLLVDKYKLNDSVSFTGMLSKKQWHKLSEDYDIFINTTNVDNTPVSVIEAMLLGLPVVSTNVGGLPFLINHEIDGLLVPKGDVEGMANSIKRLLKDKELVNTLTLNGRKKAESFDWKNVKKKWKKILK